MLTVKMKHVLIENATSWILSNLSWFCFGISLVAVETGLKLAALIAGIIASYFSVRASKATILRNSRDLGDTDTRADEDQPII